MHKARGLANVYYWNKKYEKLGINRKKHMWCPEEWAIPIIGKEEYNYLLKLSNSPKYTLNKPEEETFKKYIEIEHIEDY